MAYVDILSLLTTAVPNLLPKMCSKVNDRNLAFGFGLIPKLKTNIAETFGPVTNQYIPYANHYNSQFVYFLPTF